MNKHILFLGVLFFSFLSCMESNTPEEKIPEEKKNHRKVIIIGIDGCRPDALTAADTPNLDALMANGTFSLDARNIGTTSSGPSWSAMLTGVWEDKHGVTDNSFSGSKFGRYPHFFKRIEEANPNGRTVSVSQWHPINDKIAVSEVDIIRNPSDSSIDTKNTAVAELGIEELSAIFVHFDDVDHAGHGSGFSPSNPNYINAIELVDDQIGDIMVALKSRENYEEEDWVIIVSTDHGGIGNGHGGNSDEERTIFLIASGDNVTNKEITKTTTQTTIPPVDNCLDSASELYFKRDGIIKVPNNASHNFGATQDFSIECRFRTESPDDVAIISKKDWVSGLKPGFVFSFKPNTQKFKVNIGDGSNRVDLETEIISDNEWHTISATFDRDGMLSVYIDGEFSKSTSMSNIGNIDIDLPLTFGADGYNAFKYDGFIAEVRIFNTLLNGEEIKNWNCKTLNDTHPKYDNIQGHWKIIEGNGTTISDSSPKGLHGVLSGSEWKDAKANQIIINDNFDNTPRTIDVVKTALNHLCIPIQEVWGIEGNSIINTNCSEQ